MPIYKFVYCSRRAENRQEVVRWNAGGDPGSVNWDKLIAKIKTLFNGQYADYLITWFDGTDICTIRNDSDLRDAEEVISSSPNFQGFIRLFIAPVRDSGAAAMIPLPSTKFGIQDINYGSSPALQHITSTSTVSNPRGIQKTNSASDLMTLGQPQTQPPRHPPHPQQQYSQQHSLHGKLQPPMKNTSPSSAKQKKTINASQKVPQSNQRVNKLEVKNDDEPCYMQAKLEILRAMGYTQDDETMKSALRKYYGDMNRVLDYMSSM